MVLATTTTRKTEASARPNRARDLGLRLVEWARPRRRRTLREFAEQECWIKHGERTFPFRCSSQPVSGVFFDLFDSQEWWEVYATGPSQSSKTTTLFLIPAAYVACELKENAVYGIPLEDMVDDKFKDLFALMRRSPRLREYLPATHRGEGSGGKIDDKVVFSHGVEAKPITVGSGDAAAAAYAARWALVTEAAQWSHAKQSSPEADRLRQVKARLRSHQRPRRRLLVEGTTTVEEELPYRAQGPEEGPLLSSRTRLPCPCPHCGRFVQPEREHLVGWQSAESEQQAADLATWVCPECAAPISDEQRRGMVRSVVAVHHGQIVDVNGNVIGPRPETRTLYYRWAAFHNMLLTAADVAVDEWRATQIDEGSQDRDDAEKELCQFVHCLPHKSLLAVSEDLDASAVRRRASEYERGVLPADTQRWSVGVDVGDWTAWWVAVAGCDSGVRHVVAYGNFDVKRDREDDVAARLRHALAEFFAETCDRGMVIAGQNERRRADRTWIDGQYQTEAVAEAVRVCGSLRDNRFRVAHGVGRSQRKAFGGGSRTYTAPSSRSASKPKVGRQWYLEVNRVRRTVEATFNADYWKRVVDEGLRAPLDAPGAIVLYRAALAKEHVKFSKHMENEQLRNEWKPGKGVVANYHRAGDQHWKDALAMALAALDESGYSPTVVETPTQKPAKRVDWGAVR
jgi:hypothetical protein